MDNWDRLKRMREKLTAEDIESLRSRFDANPGALSRDEVAMLYLVARERIEDIEAKALKGNSSGGSKGRGSQ